MTKPIIILNGPAGCGKDTIASLLVNQAFYQCEFKGPMYSVALDVLGSKFQEFMDRYRDRSLKETRWEVIGMSPRQFFIKISEEWVKPTLGKQQFGILAADTCRHALPDFRGVVFSDGGFPDEVIPLTEIPGARLVVVRLHRDGYTFEGDSRNYFPDADLDVVLEDGKPYQAVNDILEYVNEHF